MPGNVLTDASATYGAITVLATDKSDAVARADGDVATYVIANWGDEVDEALININKWFAGTSSAGIAGNTARLLGRLRVDQHITGQLMHPINSTCYSTVSGSAMYLPMAGIAENSSITNYDVQWLAPFDGELVSIEWRASTSGGSTTLGMHIDENTTASCTQNQSVTGGTPITFSTWTGTTTFSKNNRLHFSWNSTSSSSSIHAAIKLRLDTNT